MLPPGMIEEKTLNQLQVFADFEPFTGSKIVVMPDCHAGNGCVIGTTIVGSKAVVPNVVGVDVCCGMFVVPLPEPLTEAKDFERFDNILRKHVPFGMRVHGQPQEIEEYLRTNVLAVCERTGQDPTYVLSSVGTLGSGNHFIEINQSQSGLQYLVIHTGSRNFGLKIAGHHQHLAALGDQSQGVPEDLAYLEGIEASNYISDMLVAKDFAEANREMIAEALLMGYYGSAEAVVHGYHCTHNYIDSDGTVRKGAISAQSGERVVIPLNMGAGVVFGTGKGLSTWNFSAPHGAGRTCSRNAIKKIARLEDFQKAMKGIWSSTVCQGTIDEAPFAYKSPQLILDAIGEAVDIQEVCRPVYNFKSPDERRKKG